jgi:hypothetical protein
VNEGALAHWGAVAPKTKKKKGQNNLGNILLIALEGPSKITKKYV